MLDVVIVGGGISGLAAAWRLEKHCKIGNYALLEAGSQWGGKMESRRVEVEGKAFLVDGGPDTILTRKVESWNMTLEAGLEGEVLVPAAETRNIYVLDNGVPRALPLSVGEFLRTQLLSWPGRLRMLAEPLIAPRRDDGDESLLAFASRRLGRQAAEKMIGPVLGGIYNADPASQSVLVSAPLMRQMEREGGSLVGGSLRRMGIRRPMGSDGKPAPRSINYKEGMAQLPKAVAAGLGGQLELHCRVSEISPLPGGYLVRAEDGRQWQARTVILATLAPVSAALLRGAMPQVAQKLGLIPHSNIGTLTLVYRQQDLPSQPPVFGLMIPRTEKRPIDAVVMTHQKMPSRGHSVFGMVRVFFGGSQPELLQASDPDLLGVVREELRALLKIEAAPLGQVVFRWPGGFPQAGVGHLGKVSEIEAILPDGLFLAGSSYRGIAVPDCIRQGNEAADGVAAKLGKPVAAAA